MAQMTYMNLREDSIRVAAPSTPVVDQSSAFVEHPISFTEVTENKSFVTIAGVPQYRIGSGDVLEVLIATGQTQERQTMVVKTNGTIAVSFVEARVDELSVEQASEVLVNLLSRYFKQLRVEVLVKEFNSKKVNILGAVRGGGPMLYPLKGKTNLLDMLASAGGLSPTADLGKIHLTQADGQSFTIDLFKVLVQAERQRIPILDDRDIIFVPEKPTQESIYVMGEVKNPRAVPYIPGLTALRAIISAGGFTNHAVLKSARIIRGDLAQPKILDGNFETMIANDDWRGDPPLQPNDIVFIPRTGIGDWNAFLEQLRPTLESITLPLQPLLFFPTLITR